MATSLVGLLYQGCRRSATTASRPVRAAPLPRSGRRTFGPSAAPPGRRPARPRAALAAQRGDLPNLIHSADGPLPAAVLGLLAVAGPAGLDRVRLAEAALHSVETRADLEHACEALRALGASALTPEQHARLTELATGDRRLVVSGAGHAMIREDEQLRAALASVLDPAA
ncbi:hypothetical protein AB0F71_12810 [Kitasatospora sp. NPDC028055]|uniref:hypothetical protein n=1 Tax=Kitasatospora sp. NPDC028055 TaxID=3155653 RepID=UPI00340CCDF5